MKVTITHLKAPWPAGAGVGDVVDLKGDVLPGWALGKCKPAADDEPVAAPPAAAKTQAAAKADKAKTQAAAQG